jgi:poly(3-hydroxyalkanoate) synthetase
MLQGWKGMHPVENYITQHVDLYEHVDDPAYRAKEETFGRWYEHPIDLPGRWYLQVITQLFKENRLARGTFVGLGRRLDLHAVTCPLYLLAGESDDITPREQVFNADHLFGTPQPLVVKTLVPGGHIGLFMGSRVLADTWPGISRWIAGR